MTAESEERTIEVGVEVDQLYRELMEELDQARRERSELIGLIKDLRRFLQQPERPVAAPMPAAASYGGAESEPVKVKEPRTGLFVDVQNIFYNARNFYGRKLDFKRLIEVTTRNRNLEAAVAYLVFSPDVDQSNFITMLQQNGYSVEEKMPHRSSEEFDPEETIIPMHRDILERVAELDLAVIVGADGDIGEFIGSVKEQGPQVELYAFTQNVADSLVHAADTFCPIDENLLLNEAYVPRQQQQFREKSGTRGGGGASHSAQNTSRGYDPQPSRRWGSGVRGAER